MLVRSNEYYINLKDNDRVLFEEIFEDNAYNVIEDEIKGKNVLDIGANIGYFSLFAELFEPAKIIAVEPSCESYILLYYNTKHLNNIKLLKFAVTEKDGDIKRIYNPAPDFGKTHTSDSHIFNRYKGEIVETISLRTLLFKFEDDNDIVVKMDIEGSEYDILMNITSDTMNKISILYIEIHPKTHPNPKYRGLETLENKLKSFNFEQVWVCPMVEFSGYDKNNKRINEKIIESGYCQIEKWRRI
jgi:FkbM family methyltransferase